MLIGKPVNKSLGALPHAILNDLRSAILHSTRILTLKFPGGSLCTLSMPNGAAKKSKMAGNKKFPRP